MGRFRAIVLLPLLLLSSCTFLGLTDEPEPAATTPAPVQPVPAPAVLPPPADLKSGLINTADLPSGFKQDESVAAEAGGTSDISNPCTGTSFENAPNAVTAFENEGTRAFVIHQVWYYSGGKAAQALEFERTAAQSCPKWTVGGATFFIWSLLPYKVGDDATIWRVIANAPRSPPLWLDVVEFRVGDRFSAIGYGQVGRTVDPAFTQRLSQTAQARVSAAR